MSQSLLLQGCFRTAGLGDVSRPGGLNPFYFRAAFGLIVAWPSGRALVSIPFTSGLLSDRRGRGLSSPSVGLNPFYFRAAFGRDERSHCRRSSGLNPFYFRAAFGLTATDDQKRAGVVSIPFTSGLLSDAGTGKGVGAMISLNPFYFRAAFGLIIRRLLTFEESQSLLLQGCFRTPRIVAIQGRPDCLNPFYFRAAFGLGRAMKEDRIRSQSLLLQGCFRTMSSIGIQPSKKRLNPFYFRAAFGRVIIAWPDGRVRLNPFYFRAAFGRASEKSSWLQLRLNPFYFRAAFGQTARIRSSESRACRYSCQTSGDGGELCAKPAPPTMWDTLSRRRRGGERLLLPACRRRIAPPATAGSGTGRRGSSGDTASCVIRGGPCRFALLRTYSLRRAADRDAVYSVSGRSRP